ncbi:hypothetical protein ACH5RR_025956 [Cinchona calisaya]|uniref:Uncharacterized protein n=1 Tax=Cinchona calisaya TaxID=153742 RepID=A0ABD2Z146_9GENT
MRDAEQNIAFFRSFFESDGVEMPFMPLLNFINMMTYDGWEMMDFYFVKDYAAIEQQILVDLWLCKKYKLNAGNDAANNCGRTGDGTARHGSGQATGHCAGNTAPRNRKALANVRNVVYCIRPKMA